MVEYLGVKNKAVRQGGHDKVQSPAKENGDCENRQTFSQQVTSGKKRGVSILRELEVKWWHQAVYFVLVLPFGSHAGQIGHWCWPRGTGYGGSIIDGSEESILDKIGEFAILGECGRVEPVKKEGVGDFQDNIHGLVGVKRMKTDEILYIF